MSNQEDSFSIKMQLLHASYYQHIKGAEEMARIGLMDRAEEMREESNRLSSRIHELKEKEKNGQEDNNGND